MKQKIFFLFCGLAFACTSVFSQTPSQLSYQEIVEKECTDQPLSEQRTYSFRILTPPKNDKGAYGKKNWLQKIFPFLVPKDKFAEDDIRLLDSKYGKPAPLGESKRSKEIRLNAEQKLKNAQEEGERKWQEWIKQNPEATAQEIQKAEISLRFKGLAAAKLAKFDWRDNGIDIGAVGEQGNECNACWAFASVDAMQANRQLTAIRSQNPDSYSALRPSARQLISCMVPKAEDFCKEGWHGDSFTFLVDKGLPLGGSRKFNKERAVWKCDAEEYITALTWDYVSAKPQNITPTDELKLALVTYGPIVTAMRYDRCLKLYGSGIFNEQFDEGGRHFVLIIGWDDEKNAWLIKNSFGTDWGENGFALIKYGSNQIGRFSAFIVANPAEEMRLQKTAKEGEK